MGRTLRLNDALARQQIAGAAVDVFDTEPLPPEHPFRRFDNLLATPHIGYVSRGLYERFYRDTVANIVAWLDARRKITVRAFLRAKRIRDVDARHTVRSG